jgi:hypothetical protein
MQFVHIVTHLTERYNILSFRYHYTTGSTTPSSEQIFVLCCARLIPRKMCRLLR